MVVISIFLSHYPFRDMNSTNKMGHMKFCSTVPFIKHISLIDNNFGTCYYPLFTTIKLENHGLNNVKIILDNYNKLVIISYKLKTTNGYKILSIEFII